MSKLTENAYHCCRNPIQKRDALLRPNFSFHLGSSAKCAIRCEEGAYHIAECNSMRDSSPVYSSLILTSCQRAGISFHERQKIQCRQNEMRSSIFSTSLKNLKNAHFKPTLPPTYPMHCLRIVVIQKSPTLISFIQLGMRQTVSKRPCKKHLA